MVRAAIYFDDQPHRRRGEIHDVITDDVLPPKRNPELLIDETGPKPAF